jgi:hypothetical protein
MRTAMIRADLMVYKIMLRKDLCDHFSAAHARGRKGR